MARGNREGVIRIYDQLAPLWDNLPISPEKNIDIFLSKMPDQRKRAIEFGCGSGKLSYALSDHFKNVACSDISEGMVKLAKKRCSSKGNIIFDIKDAKRIDFKDRFYDYIVTRTTMHHLPIREQLGVLRNIKLGVRPGGKVVIIDVVARGPFRNNIHLAVGVGCLTNLFAGIARMKRGAFSRFRGATHPTWIKQLRMDRLLTPQAFERLYGQVFESANFEYIRANLGLSSFVIMEWERPHEI